MVVFLHYDLSRFSVGRYRQPHRAHRRLAGYRGRLAASPATSKSPKKPTKFIIRSNRSGRQ